MSKFLTFLFSLVFLWAMPEGGVAAPENTKADRLAVALDKVTHKGVVRLIVRVSTPPNSALMAHGLTASAASGIALGLAGAGIRKGGLLSSTHIAHDLVAMTVTSAGLQDLQKSHSVSDVYVDRLFAPSLQHSVPAIEANTVHQNGYTGNGSVIAILDTGVDSSHPALQNHVIAEACFSSNDVSVSSTSVCPGEASNTAAAGAAVPCSMSGCEHGTHVAGIILSSSGSYQGSPIVGVAPAAKLIAVQIFSKIQGEDSCGAGVTECALSWESDQIRALEYIQGLSANSATKAVAVNMSVGSTDTVQSPCDDDTIKTNFDELWAAGIMTVVAAGNSADPQGLSSPACVSTAISVGASRGTIGIDTDYSNRAKFLTIVAPGTGIISTWPGGGYTSLDGTSMAAPHVTGTIALLHSAYPSATPAQIRNALISGTQNLTDPTTHLPFPLLNARVAMANLKSAGVASLSPTAAAPAAASQATVSSALPQPEATTVSNAGNASSLLSIRVLATVPSGGAKPSDSLSSEEKTLVQREEKVSARQYSLTTTPEIAEKLKALMQVQEDKPASIQGNVVDPNK